MCQPFEQNGREASVDELDLKLLIRRSGGDTPSPPLGSPDGSQLQQEEPMSKEQVIIYGQKSSLLVASFSFKIIFLVSTRNLDKYFELAITFIF